MIQAFVSLASSKPKTFLKVGNGNEQEGWGEYNTGQWAHWDMYVCILKVTFSLAGGCHSVTCTCTSKH